jgi:hypothetical protein
MSRGKKLPQQKACSGKGQVLACAELMQGVAEVVD